MPNNDYILRSDALKAVCENCSMHGDEGEPCSSRCEDYALVLKIPAADVELKQKPGVWLEGYGRQKCSKCGYRGYRSFKFCPNCGNPKIPEPPKGEENV